MENKKAVMSEDTFKRIIAVVIAIVTVIAALLAYLQSDASALDDRANRDSKRYSMDALGKKISGDSQVNFDYNKAYQSWYELDLLATSAEGRGDDAAAQRYRTLRDEMAALSPLMKEPYFQVDSGEVDIARYEADTYLVDVTVLTENFLAASKVKDGWDKKANAFILHLTLLAISLFLFGLSVTISGPSTRWVFAGVGLGVTLAAVVGAVTTWAEPVDDLRLKGTAIQDYAAGVGLAHQERWEDALAAFDQSLAAEPKYANALSARAEARYSLGQYDEAIQDYLAARSAGDQSPTTAGMLAWTYYLNGDFDKAIEMNRTALKSTDELWIRFDLALSMLASGKIEEARAEYQNGMDIAAARVAEVKKQGGEPPSYIWDGLDDAVSSLEDLDTIISEDGEGMPEKSSLVNPDALPPVIQEVSARLKSLSVALEYTGMPPAGTLSAQISPFVFTEPVYAADGSISEYAEGTEFAFGVQEVVANFDYSGMHDGQEVLFKVYIDGSEDPSWRISAPWELGEAGSAEKPISLAYSDNFVLSPGEYRVEMYVDNLFANSGIFVILPEE